jgi:hypothetical protein
MTKLCLVLSVPTNCPLPVHLIVASATISSTFVATVPRFVPGECLDKGKRTGDLTHATSPQLELLRFPPRTRHDLPEARLWYCAPGYYCCFSLPWTDPVVALGDCQGAPATNVLTGLAPPRSLVHCCIGRCSLGDRNRSLSRRFSRQRFASPGDVSFMSILAALGAEYSLVLRLVTPARGSYSTL